MINKKRLTAALIILVFIIFALIAVYNRHTRLNKYTEYSFDSFDTVTAVIGYAKSREEFDEIYKIITDELNEYHKLFTVYEEYDGLNNLYTVNKHGEVKVDQRIIDMLAFSVDMYELTGGKVNIALGSVLGIWHDYRESGTADPENAKLPSYEELACANSHTNIENLIIDKENSTVLLTDPEMTLDVGAIAKGYAVEKVAQKLEERGIGGYIINVGGNVRTVGTKPDGKEWNVGIDNPDRFSSQAYVENISLKGESLVTSGSYQRYYIVNGESYHHIIDPKTLMPAEHFVSVSVICKDSGLADALSTALFTMSYDEGRGLVEGIDGVEAMWMLENGEKMYSSEFHKYIAK